MKPILVTLSIAIVVSSAIYQYNKESDYLQYTDAKIGCVDDCLSPLATPTPSEQLAADWEVIDCDDSNQPEHPACEGVEDSFVMYQVDNKGGN